MSRRTSFRSAASASGIARLSSGSKMPWRTGVTKSFDLKSSGTSSRRMPRWIGGSSSETMWCAMMLASS